MSTGHLNSAQFHSVHRFHRLTRKQKGHPVEPAFSNKKTLVGFRPETKLGAKRKNPGGLVGPETKMKKPGTYVLHAPAQRVYKKDN